MVLRPQAGWLAVLLTPGSAWPGLLLSLLFCSLHVGRRCQSDRSRDLRAGGSSWVDLRGYGPQFSASKYLFVPLWCCHRCLEFPDWTFMC